MYPRNSFFSFELFVISSCRMSFLSILSLFCECMHVHASDKKLTEGGSAKFFLNSDGSTVVQNRDILSDIEINKLQKLIKINYLKMIENDLRIATKRFFDQQ